MISGQKTTISGLDGKWECGVRSAECGAWKMWSMENAEYGKCGVFFVYNIKTESGKHAARH